MVCDGPRRDIAGGVGAAVRGPGAGNESGRAEARRWRRRRAGNARMLARRGRVMDNGDYPSVLLSAIGEWVRTGVLDGERASSGPRRTAPTGRAVPTDTPDDRRCEAAIRSIDETTRATGRTPRRRPTVRRGRTRPPGALRCAPGSSTSTGSSACIGSSTRGPPSRGEASGTLLDIMCIIGNSGCGVDQPFVRARPGRVSRLPATRVRTAGARLPQPRRSPPGVPAGGSPPDRAAAGTRRDRTPAAFHGSPRGLARAPVLPASPLHGPAQPGPNSSQ